MIDVLLLLLLALIAFRGYLRGFVMNVLELAALIVACISSWYVVAPMAYQVIAAHVDWTPGLAYIVAVAGSALALYLPLIILANALDRSIGRNQLGELRGWNRKLGLVCGIVSGLVMVLIVALALDVTVKVFPDSNAWPVRASRTSLLRRAVTNRNPADRYLITDTLLVLRIAQQDPKVLDELRKDPQLQKIVYELMANPAVKALSKDESLARAISEGRFEAVLANANVRRLMADREVHKLISSLEFRDALHQAVKKAQESRVEAESPAPEGQAGGSE